MYTTLSNRPMPRRYDPFTIMDAVMRPFFEGDHPAPMGIRTDISETPHAWLLSAELPGVKPADIHLTVENDVLTVEADVNTERKTEQNRYVCTERRSGHVRRSYNLEGVAQDGISAAYDNGVLRITLPKEKPEEAKGPRTIAITEADDAAPVDTEHTAEA
ncbi:MAG: Hsp20/alpha crystallin family protein [Clostridia bacterium]|nr:Hsp20/alpha crystallin family protein [Clostridia bacterium]MBQ9373449.1 Hsp20/alpha crystallin family protein [Oscillospiraceae bacterium]